MPNTVSESAPREFQSNDDRFELYLKMQLSFTEVMVEQVPHILGYPLAVWIQETALAQFPEEGFGIYAAWMGQRTPSVFRPTGPHLDIVD
jgi:hypothetical protein